MTFSSLLTLEGRRIILDKLLETEANSNMVLIRDEEIEKIKNLKGKNLNKEMKEIISHLIRKILYMIETL